MCTHSPRGAAFLLAAASLLGAGPLTAQTGAAEIEEETRIIETYPFSNPDPNPILIRDARLYPYHAFDDYARKSEPRPWKVVRMENAYLVVFVLPEVGGKVWGAIEKSTGEEFIYRNEVLKFRNIALRGPWTSGGIEFNFGVIGHSPATATPVDYVLRRHDDGSVSCTVGALDLPSRTPWRVQIVLPADVAYFETRSLWYNPTPVRQAYYNWMTGAAFARDDLEVVFPGRQYLKHDGQARPWPVDAAGRNLSRYDENRFGSHKSYHVVGARTDFFGGYYHDADYGFGHWAPYEDMPGRKLWLWALSREGGIWEDLLTDTDGQYVEFQAGRLLVQYAPGAGVNPIRQAGFEPYRTDRWTERWFPIKGIGGMSVASGRGVLHVEREVGRLRIGINALVAARGALEVRAGGRVAREEPLDLRPMEVYEVEFPVPDEEDYEILVPALDLRYANSRETETLRRPFATNPAARKSTPVGARKLNEARELVEARRYGLARAEIDAVLSKRPWHREALLVRADLEYRAARYEEGLDTIRRALQLDAYDAEANFLAGNLYRATGDFTNAAESFGWAARSMAFRAAAYTQLAELSLQEDDARRAARYAERALDYDRYGIDALEVQALAARLAGNEDLARKTLDRLLALDPLHHFVRSERGFLGDADGSLDGLPPPLGGEFPDQSLLELAIGYHDRGRDAEARKILARARDENPLRHLWSAWLQRETAPEAARLLVEDCTALSPAFVFPYRRETIAVLEWADGQSDDWKLDYWLALNLWAVARPAEALRRLDDAGPRPDYGPFYVSRAHLGREVAGRDPEEDLRRAAALDEAHWQTALLLARHLLDHERWSEAAAVARATAARFPANFNVELVLAEALLFDGELDESIALLDRVEVLPSEMGRKSHQLFAWAHVTRALRRLRAGDDEGAVSDLEESLRWPAHLGQGRPFEPDERLAHYLLAHAHWRRGEERAAREFGEKVIEASRRRGPRGDATGILALRLLADTGRGAEARALLRELAGPRAARDPETRWILARARRDETRLSALRRAYPARFSSPAFRLLNDALDATAANGR